MDEEMPKRPQKKKAAGKKKKTPSSLSSSSSSFTTAGATSTSASVEGITAATTPVGSPVVPRSTLAATAREVEYGQAQAQGHRKTGSTSSVESRRRTGGGTQAQVLRIVDANVGSNERPRTPVGVREEKENDDVGFQVRVSFEGIREWRRG